MLQLMLHDFRRERLTSEDEPTERLSPYRHQPAAEITIGIGVFNQSHGDPARTDLPGWSRDCAAVHHQERHQVAGKGPPRRAGKPGRRQPGVDEPAEMAKDHVRANPPSGAAAVGHDAPALHDEDDPGRISPKLGLGQRVTRNGNEIGLLARLQGADDLRQAEQLRRL